MVLAIIRIAIFNIENAVLLQQKFKPDNNYQLAYENNNAVGVFNIFISLE